MFSQLELAATRFLQRRVSYAGFVVYDPAMRDAVLAQRPVVDHLPQSPSSRCFRLLASHLSGRVPHTETRLRLVAPGATQHA